MAAGANPFVAEVCMVAFNFAPQGYATCDGQLMPLSLNIALFSLLGTNYGGDGKATFGLPNFQGSAPMAPGQGPGLSLHDLGEVGGTQTVTLLSSEMPVHTHGFTPKIKTGIAPNTINAVNSLPAVPDGASPPNLYSATTNGTDFMAPMNVNLDPQTSLAGGSAAHNNMQPYLCVYFLIALQGIFPPRQ